MRYTIDKDKVPIQLTPYNALTLLAFLREYEYDEPNLQALGEAVKEFEDQVYSALTDKQLEDAKAENQVNQLIGKSPTR